MKNLDWANLSFGYMKTDYNVRCYYRDGKWGEIEVCSDEYLKLHMAATCLHYGQEAFEGLKAYRCPDGKVRIFRPEENAERLQSTCRGIMMPEVPTELFVEMVKKVVRLNQEWIPTYESGATLYIRPLLIGTSAQVGVHPAKEYCFLIFVTPVGPYFKGGFATNPYVIIRDYDRSAPLGTGIYKVGGNYAASLFANNLAHEKGYACEFYLDAKEKKYIDECGAANFFGIKDNTYVTPKSTSILPSITNKSLMQVAEDLGMKVERRPIPEEELETFEEAGACGTAAVISAPSATLTTWRPASATISARSPARSRRNSSTPCAASSTARSKTSTAGQRWSSNKNMSKGKLAKFADMETYRNVFQYPYSVVSDVPFAMRGHWREQYFKNDNPIVLELGCGKGEYAVGLAKRHPDMQLHRRGHQGSPHVDRCHPGPAGRTEERGLPAHQHRDHRPLLRPRRGAGDMAHLQRPADEEPAQAPHVDLLPGALPPLPDRRGHHPPEDRLQLPLHLHHALVSTTSLPVSCEDRRPLCRRRHTADSRQGASIQTYYEQMWLSRGISIKYMQFLLPHDGQLEEPDIEIELDDYRSYHRTKRSSLETAK